jgi:hypothetical protein
LTNGRYGVITIQRRWTCVSCGRHLGIVFRDPAQDRDMIRLVITPYDDPDDVEDRHIIEASLPVECNCGCGAHNAISSMDDCSGEYV